MKEEVRKVVLIRPAGGGKGQKRAYRVGGSCLLDKDKRHVERERGDRSICLSGTSYN